MTCNNSIHHDLNCPDSYNNNALKSASASATASISAVNQQQQKQLLVFNQQEVNILDKSLKACQFYITKNKNQYQNPQDIIKELTTASNIVNARRQKNKQNQNQQSLKGASLDININNPFKSLDNIRKMVGLTTSNESASHLKGASDSTQNNNNICSKKEHLKDLLKQFNLI